MTEEKETGQTKTPWEVRPAQMGRAELECWGRALEKDEKTADGRTGAMALARMLLVVRTRNGAPKALEANAAQRTFELNRRKKNIVLKARQMGLTTWAAARFFLKTITRPGTLTLEVAHTQEAAEEIFRIVHRFVDWLPDGAARRAAARRRGPMCGRSCFREMDAQYRVVSAADRNAGRGIDGAEPALLASWRAGRAIPPRRWRACARPWRRERS